MVRNDPIRKSFFRGVEKAESASSYIFGAGLILSFLVLLIDKTEHPSINSFFQVSFLIFVIAAWFLDLLTRLHLKPKADAGRMKDFLTHAYGIPLHHLQTTGYYNNAETIPHRKVGAQLLENSFNSKDTALKMVIEQRCKMAVYIIIWLYVVFNRDTDFEKITIFSQALFGEQLLSKYLRLEWTRMRYEKVYEELYTLFGQNPPDEHFQQKVTENLVVYEATKAHGGILLSEKIWRKNQFTLTQEWDLVKKALRIA